MRILILEDDQNRIDWFNTIFDGQEVWITKNPQEANKWLKEIGFDYIFLDHDLEEKHYWYDSKCNKTTGLCTAEFLEQNKEVNAKAEIIIHSMNYNGARRMQQALKGRPVKDVPFHFLQGQLVVNSR